MEYAIRIEKKGAGDARASRMTRGKGGEGMKKQIEKDVNPYANVSGGRIVAPHKPTEEPKGSTVRGGEDLRK